MTMQQNFVKYFRKGNVARRIITTCPHAFIFLHYVDIGGGIKTMLFTENTLQY